ncbi:uncharacterized protein LOC128509077 [Clarias gariepinus]|uniref:uncharacterized protein LOC128509077 n=1 Tax=Clarias gariepinus TaxID=13013 RepID=UPI00234D4BBA|nr:uncharacterized protein LOC128509077 [Clarias gariepinus]
MDENFPEVVELGEKQTSPSAPGPGNMAALKRKYTIEEKRQILELYDQLPRMSQRKAAKRLNITPSTLWTIIHNRAGIVKGEIIKRERKKYFHYGRSPRLEANIWKWIDQAKLNGTPVTDLMIHRKSMEIAARMGILSFRPSPRWYSGFKKREPVVRERYHIYPESVLDHTAPCSSPPPDDPRETSDHQTPKECVPVSDSEQEEEEEKMKSSSTVTVGMKTITVPSVHQMQEAMKTLATGLLYRGFCDFKLLHEFEKEVNLIVKRSVTQGSQESFIA